VGTLLPEEHPAKCSMKSSGPSDAQTRAPEQQGLFLLAAREGGFSSIILLCREAAAQCDGCRRGVRNSRVGGECSVDSGPASACIAAPAGE
jgi:hypothetical protein